MAAIATINFNVEFKNKSVPVEKKVTDACNLSTTQTGSVVDGAIQTVFGSAWTGVNTGSITTIGKLVVINKGTGSFLDLTITGSGITASRLAYGDAYIYQPIDNKNLYMKAIGTASVSVCGVEK